MPGMVLILAKLSFPKMVQYSICPRNTLLKAPPGEGTLKLKSETDLQNFHFIIEIEMKIIQKIKERYHSLILRLRNWLAEKKA